MLDTKQDTSISAQQGQKARSRLDNEGGAGLDGLQVPHTVGAKHWDDPPFTDVEVVQLWVRVISVENLVIVLLAQTSEEMWDAGRKMANCISLRPGAKQHRLTTHAATHMFKLLERSTHFLNL